MSIGAGEGVVQSWRTAEQRSSLAESSHLLVQQVADALAVGTSRPKPRVQTMYAWAAFAALVIGLVSAYDIYLTIVYWSSLPEMELNPLGRRILFPNASGYDVHYQLGLFIGLKCAGTMVVMSVLQLLAAFHYRYTIPVVCGVAGFQILLVMFFVLSDGRPVYGAG